MKAILKNNTRIAKLLEDPEVKSDSTKIYRRKLPSFDFAPMFGIWRYADTPLYEKLTCKDPEGDLASTIELPTNLVISYMNLLANELAKEHGLAVAA